MKSFNHNSGKYFSMDDAKIYYETAGNTNKPVLLLLHGGFGNIEDFNVILPSLFDEFHIIGVDSRGQGKSTLGKGKLTYERIQHDLEALLKFLNIDRLSILGFSDGATVAFRLASLSSLNIEKLIAIGCTWNINDILSIKDVFLKITPDSWKEKFPETYTTYQRLNSEADFNTLTTSLKNMWLDTTSSGHPNENVNHINCPTLIVRGDQDHLVSSKSVVELTGHIKNSTLLNIPFAGHVVYQDQTEIFNNIFTQFMADKNYR